MRVRVIGGGLTGLALAERLASAGPGAFAKGNAAEFIVEHLFELVGRRRTPPQGPAAC